MKTASDPTTILSNPSIATLLSVSFIAGFVFVFQEKEDSGGGRGRVGANLKMRP